MKLIAIITDKEVLGKEIRFNGKHSLRIAARAIVLSSDNEIALLNATKYKFHKLPGGGIKKGENRKRALERELQEEIGCKIKITKEVGKIIEIKNEYGHKQISYCYIAKVLSEGKSNLTNEQWEKLKDYSQNKGISVSELIVKLLEEKL